MGDFVFGVTLTLCALLVGGMMVSGPQILSGSKARHANEADARRPRKPRSLPGSGAAYRGGVTLGRA